MTGSIFYLVLTINDYSLQFTPKGALIGCKDRCFLHKNHKSVSKLCIFPYFFPYNPLQRPLFKE
ncbi:hypothetical protein EVA_19646 [gut metagenome]|uniref:Uncharacterized protein n=1 Tax=gut metagenome TaxID=749906 RepID=J9FY16_9ZZZZ